MRDYECGYGYTTDDNGWMAFRGFDDSANADVMAFYDGNWIKTSYDSRNQYEVKTEGLDGANVTATPTIINGGAYVKLLYTVTNNSDTAITGGKLAIHSDIQIGDNDKAAIEIIRDGDGKAIGFRMIDDHTTDDCLSRGAQLNLYFAGTGGVTDADTYWFGHYTNKEKNAFNTISDETASSSYVNKYSKDDNGNYIKLSNVDSGIAFSWQNIELAAGESKEFSWVINVGTEAQPPQWGDAVVNLTVTADATQNDRNINAAAKVKDAAGVTDKLYYSVNEGSGILLGGVIADGATEKNITGVIDTSDWPSGTYNLDFWVVNSKGAVSEKVRRTITVANGEITGDVTVLNPELSHDWDTAWNYDETNHWHDCKNSNCTISDNADKNGFAAHEFDSACDATCNTCGYTRTITHTFNQKVMSERYLASAGTCTQRAKYYYSCTCGAAGTTTFFGDTVPHEYVYTADGAVITETCAGDCGHVARATITAPENLTYDGTAKAATVSYSNGWKGGALTVSYGSHGNVNVGTVTASITKNGKKAVLSYDITAANVVVTPPTAIENLVYDGSARALVTAGSTTGGTMQYALGTASAAPAGGWSTAVPKAQIAGTIAVGRKLNIRVPAQQTGYTLTSSTYAVDYLGGADLTFTLAEGYSKTANFAILLNGKSDAAWANDRLSVRGIDDDLNITVDGVADITPPTAKIKVKDNAWTAFLNHITFGLFFKETQNVTVTASDNGSGVDKVQYYVGEGQLEYDELRSITDWADYNGEFALRPDNRYVVYVRVTDKAGNILYISSDGLVFDSVAPVFDGIENGGVYYGEKVIRVLDEYRPVALTVDGVDVTDEIADDAYTIAADNQEHTLVATDKAGNVTEYRITVYKNYTVTFKIDGETVGTETVGHGKSATLPPIPEKEGYDQTAPVWDNDGAAITADTEIHAVYTINEYTITFMDENGVYKTLTYKHGETVEMPDVPAKDGYTVRWETVIREATADATVKAVYTKNPTAEKPTSPYTGTDAVGWLWIMLLFVSGGAVMALRVCGKKCKFGETK